MMALSNDILLLLVEIAVFRVVYPVDTAKTIFVCAALIAVLLLMLEIFLLMVDLLMLMDEVFIVIMLLLMLIDEVLVDMFVEI